MKKIYLIPNLVTTANLYCGFFAVVKAQQGAYEFAAWLIVLAAVFDLLDGRIARLAKATSSFGVEYDSLSDLMSFGIAPALLVYEWSLKPLGKMGFLIAFLYVVCTAFRLARFNVTADENIPAGYFVGLPSPMAANLISTFVIFNTETNIPYHRPLEYFTLTGTIVLAVLMSSRFLFPSFKGLNWRSRASFGLLLFVVAVMIFILLNPEINLFITLMSYVVFCLLWKIFPLTWRKKIIDSMTI